MRSQVFYGFTYAAAIFTAAVFALFSAYSERMAPMTKVTEFVLCAGVVLVCEMSLRAMHDHCEWNLRMANRFLLGILAVAGVVFSLGTL